MTLQIVDEYRIANIVNSVVSLLQDDKAAYNGSFIMFRSISVYVKERLGITLKEAILAIDILEALGFFLKREKLVGAVDNPDTLTQSPVDDRPGNKFNFASVAGAIKYTFKVMDVVSPDDIGPAMLLIPQVRLARAKQEVDEDLAYKAARAAIAEPKHLQAQHVRLLDRVGSSSNAVRRAKAAIVISRAKLDGRVAYLAKKQAAQALAEADLKQFLLLHPGLAS